MRAPQVLVFQVHQAPRPAQRLAAGEGDAALAGRRERVSAAPPVRVRAEHLHRVTAARLRVGQLGRAGGRFDGAQYPVPPATQRAAGQRGGVLPPFPEDRFHVGDGRALDGDLDVVPRRAGSVGGAQRARLLVAVVRVVIPAAVAQVDPAHVRHIPLGAASMAQHDQLLVMRSAVAHPHIQQAFAARGNDSLAEIAVFLQAVPEPVQVRAPEQAADDHAAAGRVGQHPRHLRARAVEPLIRVAPPVGEQQQVAWSHGADAAKQFGEVRGTVQQRAHPVPGGPCSAVVVAGVQPRGGIAALISGEEPPVKADVPRSGAPPRRLRRARPPPRCPSRLQGVWAGASRGGCRAGFEEGGGIGAELHAC